MSKQQIKLSSPIHIDDTLLVTIGRRDIFEKDQIAVYDARVPAKLMQIQSSAVDFLSGAWVSSNGIRITWDFQSSRWFSLSDGFGILVIPLRFYTIRKPDAGSFDGYILYDVSLTAGISRRFNISHVQSDKYYDCYETKRFVERVFVINGSTITTTKGHSILSTNFQTGRQRSRVEIPNLSNRKCCVDWYTPATVCTKPI